MTRRRTVTALIAIVAVGAALRLSGLGDEPFWLDEAHTANFTRLSLGELWSFSDPFDTVNPPGFIVAMKLWTQVSRSDEWFRLLPALAGIATIPIVYAAGARMAGTRAGLFSAGLIAVAGYHVRYSQEARAYALITLMAAVALWSVTQIVSQPDGDHATPLRRKPKPARSAGQGLRRAVTWTDVAWPVYGVATGLSLHLHNTSAGIPLAANLAIGLWWLSSRPRPPRVVRNWAGANLLALLVWSPWLPGFFSQLRLVQANFWVTPPTPASVTRDLGTVIDAYAGLAIPGLDTLWFHTAVIALTVTTIWWGARSLDSGHRFVLWSFILVQPAFQLVFSLRQPVFLSRTLLWILLASAVGLGVAFERALSASHRLWTLAPLAVLVTALLGTIGYHTAFEKTAWDRAAAMVAAGAGDDDLILILSGNNIVAFDRYFETTGIEAQQMRIPWDIPDRREGGSVLTDADVELIAEEMQDHPRTWLVLSTVGSIDGGARLAPELSDRFNTVSDERFTEVRVMAFED